MITGYHLATELALREVSPCAKTGVGGRWTGRRENYRLTDLKGSTAGSEQVRTSVGRSQGSAPVAAQ